MLEEGLPGAGTQKTYQNQIIFSESNGVPSSLFYKVDLVVISYSIDNLREKES